MFFLDQLHDLDFSSASLLIGLETVPLLPRLLILPSTLALTLELCRLLEYVPKVEEEVGRRVVVSDVVSSSSQRPS